MALRVVLSFLERAVREVALGLVEYEARIRERDPLLLGEGLGLAANACLLRGAQLAAQLFSLCF